MAKKLYFKSLVIAIVFSAFLYLGFISSNIFSLLASSTWALIFGGREILILIKWITLVLATIFISYYALSLASKVEQRQIPTKIKLLMLSIICINWIIYLGLGRIMASIISNTRQGNVASDLNTTYNSITIQNELLQRIEYKGQSAYSTCEYSFDIIKAPPKEYLDKDVTLFAGISADPDLDVKVGQPMPREFNYGFYVYTKTIGAQETDKNPPYSQKAKLVLKSLGGESIKVARDFSVYIFMLKFKTYYSGGKTLRDTMQPIIQYYKFPTTVDWSICDFVSR